MVPEQLKYNTFLGRDEVASKFAFTSKFSDKDICNVFHRFLGYLTVRNPTQEEMWEYLNKIVVEKETRQPVLPLSFTEDSIARVEKYRHNPLDKS